MTPTTRVCWDSCVIIDYIQKTDGRYDILREIVDQARSGEVVLVVSALACAEVYKIDKDKPLSADDERKIKDFFENEYVSVRNVTRFIGMHAAKIAREHGLPPPDAIHVATALKYKCSVLHTYDGCGVRKKRKHLLKHDREIGSPPLPIEEPRGPEREKTLFET